MPFSSLNRLNFITSQLKKNFILVHFFAIQGSQYWRFENQQEKPGYPRAINRGFNGLPDNLDAAFTWSGNGNAYFVKGKGFTCGV